MPAKTELTALSIRQPWAAALLEAGKWCECRSWQYPTRHRGPLWVHASSWSSRLHPVLEAGEPWLSQLWDKPTPLANITGAIIGRVEVVAAADSIDTEECYQILAGISRRKPTPSQLALMPFLPPVDDSIDRKSDPWRWWLDGGIIVCRNPEILKVPIQTKGRLNLWRLTVPSDRLVFRETRQKKRHRHRRRGRLDDPGDE